MKPCPFKIGDKVRFQVADTKLANSTAKPQLKPGSVGRVTAIHDGRYLRIDKVREWWHWTNFSKVVRDLKESN